MIPHACSISIATSVHNTLPARVLKTKTEQVCREKNEVSEFIGICEEVERNN